MKNSPLPRRGLVTMLHSGFKSMFDRRIALAIFASSALALSSGASAADVSGYWLTSDGKSIVEIAPCGSSSRRMCGKTVWVAGAEAGKVGAEVLRSFRQIGRKTGERWGKGKVMIAADKERDGKLRFEEGKLTVSACRRSRCSNEVWVRPSSTMTAEAGLGSGGE